MRAGERAGRNAVAVNVSVAAKFARRFELLAAEHFAAVVGTRIVPLERGGEMRIHAYVEIQHDEHQRLQALSEIKRARAEFERLAWPVGDQEHMLGVAVRCEGCSEKVRLLGARWHARGWP